MKKIVSSLIFALFCVSAFAFEVTSSGKQACIYSIENGNLPLLGSVDMNSYLNDFAFPYKNRKDEKISVFVQQKKDFVYSTGDENCVQVGIKANSKEFFTQNDVNFVIFLTNPAFLTEEKGNAVFKEALTKIFEQKTNKSKVALYDAVNEKFIFIDGTLIDEGLNSVCENPRVKEIEFGLQKIVKLANDSDKNAKWQVALISDQDEFKNPKVLDSFFDIPLVSALNLNFDYIGYGVQSDWNEVTGKVKSSTKSKVYYENTYKSLENRLVGCFEKSSYGGEIKNIEVKIVPEKGFTMDNYYFEKLGYDESILLTCRMKLPAKFNYGKDEIQYAQVSVKYTDSDGAIFYKVYPLCAKYSEDAEQIEGCVNKVIARSEILKDTALILTSCNENFMGATKTARLVLIENQIQKLLSIDESLQNYQIEDEILMLQNLKSVIAAM